MATRIFSDFYGNAKINSDMESGTIAFEGNVGGPVGLNLDSGEIALKKETNMGRRIKNSVSEIRASAYDAFKGTFEKKESGDGNERKGYNALILGPLAVVSFFAGSYLAAMLGAIITIAAMDDFYYKYKHCSGYDKNIDKIDLIL